MQVLWRKVFDGNCPLTVDEFLYCYKPSKISQSLGFYQFSVKSSNCRLVKSLPTSDRKWKTEFFFISGFWVGNLVEVGKNPFPPYNGEMRNLCLEGMSFFHYLFHFFCCTRLTFFFFFFFFFKKKTAIRQPTLSKFHLDCIHRARSFADRTFHYLAILRCLTSWGLGPEPIEKALTHELTNRKCEFS